LLRNAAVSACGGFALAAVSLAACAAPAPAGAPAPPKGLTLAPPDAVAAAAQPPAAGRDDSPAAAATVVRVYFDRINAASTAGRAADISDLALTGCQPCTTDVAATQTFADGGLHADVGSLAVSAITAGQRLANGISVRFSLVVRPQRLLDPAGQVTASYQGQNPRSGTAVLALTARGWRIQTFVYAGKPT
jgi:hypothetical protein